jgi:DNA-binding transcriptional regulator YiaG
MNRITPDQITPDMIREMRGKLGITQQMLAKRLGTYQKTISHWETGAKKPDRLYRMLLTVAINEVLNGSSDGH